MTRLVPVLAKLSPASAPMGARSDTQSEYHSESDCPYQFNFFPKWKDSSGKVPCFKPVDAHIRQDLDRKIWKTRRMSPFEGL